MIGAPIIMVITQFANLYSLLIFVWAIFSWFDHSRGILKDIYNVLNTLVGPYVNIFRRFLPRLGGMDFSPFLALIVLQIAVRFLSSLLMRL
jgi:YggT family protein